MSGLNENAAGWMWPHHFPVLPCHSCGAVDTPCGDRCAECSKRAEEQPDGIVDTDEDEYNYDREQVASERAEPHSEVAREARREALDETEDEDFVLE